jgi:hypothetical protein
MATKITGQFTAADAPVIFTAYEDFALMIDIDAGTNTILLQWDLADDENWQTVDTFTSNFSGAVEVPVGGLIFRLYASVFDTGPINYTIYGKLNLNDTVGGASPFASVIDENGEDVLQEDSQPVLEEAA